MPSRQLLIYFGVAIVLVGALVAGGLWLNRGAHVELKGTIQRVRTLATDEKSSVAIADFRFVNPADYPFVVRVVTVTFEDAKGAVAKDAPPKIPEATLQPAAFADLRGWETDDHLAAFKTFLKSCDVVIKNAGKAATANIASKAPPADLANACRAAQALTSPTKASAKAFFEQHFVPNRVVQKSPPGLLTGYYEPVLEGSRTPTEKFKTPVYKRPPDLVNVVAEADRASKPDGLTHVRQTDKGVEPFEAGRQVREADPLASAGNGAVARCLPIGIRYHDAVDRLVRVSTQQAAITHADERCLWGAVAVNLAVRELLHGNSYFVDEVMHRIEGRAPRVLVAAIRRSLREDQGELPVTVEGQTGYVVHCVETAFWFASHGRTLEDALVYLAQAGGDTGTNAAVTGALLGARDGEVAVPQRWMGQLVEPRRLTRLAELLLETGREPAARAPE